ncbi:MAG: methyltransferase [Planctomycetaceae bacterium]
MSSRSATAIIWSSLSLDPASSVIASSTSEPALIETMEIRPGQRVLDFGCGSGGVGFAAALRAENVHVHAVDSNPRALACTAAGASLNGLGDRLTTSLSGDGSIAEPGTFDVAMGNPPYYSHYTIAEIFLQGCKRGLKPGGRVLIVAKQTEWLIARMKQLFREVDTHEVREYTVVTGVKFAGS